MYGTFIFINAGFLLSLRSLIGLILAILFMALQYFNAKFEEKRTLLPLFSKEYEEYIKKVPTTILSIKEFGVIVIFALFSIIGLAA